MKLSRLYSNLDHMFEPIRFNLGLNVILAEIRSPEATEKDTHNLGKTTVAHLIDFCLLKKRSKSFFLFKHMELFKDFVFFLELLLPDSSFVTVRRAVGEASKISFKYGQSSGTYAALEADGWDHWRVPFDKSKELLDARLGFSIAHQWTFRKPLGYALRLQDDYNSVFQLSKFRGAHVDWKPFLAEVLGLDGELVRQAYTLAAEVDAISRTIAEHTAKLESVADSPDRLEGMILLRRKEVETLAKKVERFDFRAPDSDVSEELVNEIETEVSRLNERRYHLRMSLKTIQETLGETIHFDLNSVSQVFAEAEVYFTDQIKKDYHDLLGFLRSISEERAELLGEERRELSKELEVIEGALKQLNVRRVRALAALKEAKSLEKFRKYTEQLIDLKAALAMLERQRDYMDEATELRGRLRRLQQERSATVDAVQANITSSTRQQGIYRNIRLDFGSIVKRVLDRDAILSSRLNQHGNIDFEAAILNESGTATSEDDGHTYRKLLCIAFDVALFSAYLDEHFVHFVFHDGVFESLDDRKKICLLDELRKRSEAGLQQVITLIDSDLPTDEGGKRMAFPDREVVRVLHDGGSQGRLFRMTSW